MNYNAVQKFHILVMIFMIPFLMGIGIDLYVPSLPAITNYFQVSPSVVQLTITFYILANGIGHLILGILSDSLGRRKIIVVCAFFYTAVSLLSSFVPNIYLLISCRFLQGLAISGLAVVSRAVASDCFCGKELAKALTYISLAWAAGPIIGPFIGSYLQHYFHWQANFYFFSAYGLCAFIYTYIFLPETHFKLVEPNAKKILHNIQQIVMQPIFLFGMLLLMFAYASLVLFHIIGPFLIQDILGYSALFYGRLSLMLGLGYFLGNLSSRFLLNYFSPMKIAITGILCDVVISIMMLFLGVMIKLKVSIIIVPIWLLLFFCALIFPNIQAKCFSLFPQSGGVTSAIYGVFVVIGGSLVLMMLSRILPTNSQVPMTFAYIGLFLACLMLYLIIYHFNKKMQKE